jgi:hypothetical protein
MKTKYIVIAVIIAGVVIFWKKIKHMIAPSEEKIGEKLVHDAKKEEHNK